MTDTRNGQIFRQWGTTFHGHAAEHFREARRRLDRGDEITFRLVLAHAHKSRAYARHLDTQEVTP